MVFLEDKIRNKEVIIDCKDIDLKDYLKVVLSVIKDVMIL